LIDLDTRLKSGMKAAEALKGAQEWWQRAGRHAMKKVANRETVGHKFIPASTGLSGVSAAILIKGEDVDVLPSGLLRGLEWDRLTRREQLQIVKHWHHHFVYLPAVNPDKPEEAKPVGTTMTQPLDG
jgi:hypothetical protein